MATAAAFVAGRPFVAVAVAIGLVSFTGSLSLFAGLERYRTAGSICAAAAILDVMNEADSPPTTSTRYLVLFKGINIGRAKRIAMADLRRVLGELGYGNVATHLQSGNAVFSAAEDAPAVAAAVRTAVRAELGVDAAVVIRTEQQLSAAIAADPYSDIADDPGKHLLGFFSAVPDAERLAAFRHFLDAQHFDPDVAGLHSIGDDHCFLWCPQGSLLSPFGTVDWRKLGVTVTMRNWSTVLRLAQLLKG